MLVFLFHLGNEDIGMSSARLSKVGSGWQSTIWDWKWQYNPMKSRKFTGPVYHQEHPLMWIKFNKPHEITICPLGSVPYDIHLFLVGNGGSKISKVPTPENPKTPRPQSQPWEHDQWTRSLRRSKGIRSTNDAYRSHCQLLVLSIQRWDFQLPYVEMVACHRGNTVRWHATVL